MYKKKEKYQGLEKLTNKIEEIIKKANIEDLSYFLESKKEIIVRNLIAGIFRGIGIGIGVTIITAIIVLMLQKIVTLNIPIIGEFVSDIIDIVEKNKY